MCKMERESTCVTTHILRSKDNFVELVLSYYFYVCSRGQTEDYTASPSPHLAILLALI